MRIKNSQVCANTDVLSPIDRETWKVIAQVSGVNSTSRVIELASGKGAFARYLAKNFRCRVDGIDRDADFVFYSNGKAAEEGLQGLVNFRNDDVNQFKVELHTYDLGVCLGALYIFREAGWKILTTGIRPSGCLAVSDIFCKKSPTPNEIMQVFFEEEDDLLTISDLRQWYRDRGFRIVREVECSRTAWLEYYDLRAQTLHDIEGKNASDEEILNEVARAKLEGQLIREYGEEFVGYMTFIMRRNLIAT